MSTTIGHYQIIGELGRGGMGVVYKAHEQSLNRYVAIKMLGDQVVNDPNLRARFLREARSAAALNHPNIIQIYYVGEDQGRPYFAMEYVAGVSLAQVIRSERQLEPKRAAGILLQAASGLARAHDQGIIHRDIKPGNIMMDPHGLVKLADFGIAHVVENGDKLTATGQFLGTPGYLSPEVCLGKPIEKRSDIFSLGIVYYEMLTGQTPFRSDSPLAMLKEVVESQVPDPRGLNAGVDLESHLILMKMVAKSPDERYPDCHHLIQDLKRYLGKDALNLMALPLDARPRVEEVPTVPAMVGEATAAAARANDETEIITPYARQTAPPIPPTPPGGHAAALPPQAKTEIKTTPDAGMPLPNAHDAKADTLHVPPVVPGGRQGAKRSGGVGRLLAVALLLLCLAAVGGWYVMRPSTTSQPGGEPLVVDDVPQTPPDHLTPPEPEVETAANELDPPAVAEQGTMVTENSFSTTGDRQGGTDRQTTTNTTNTRPSGQTNGGQGTSTPLPPVNSLQKANKNGSGTAQPLDQPGASKTITRTENTRKLLIEAAGDPLLARPLVAQLDALLKEKGYIPLDREALGLDGSTAAVRELSRLAKENHAQALVLAQVTALSQRELNYMNSYSTAYKVEVKIKCWAPGGTERLGDEFRTTLEYTTINAERKAEEVALKAIDQVAESLAAGR